MQKPLTSHGKRLSTKNLKQTLPQVEAENQAFREIQKYIDRHQLTNALNFLEQRGYYGDAAIFMLTYLQQEVAA